MDEFHKNLSNFVHDWCEAEAQKRRASEYRAQLEKEIIWVELKIQDLEKQLEKRPSVIKQINDLKRQIHEKEVNLAFNPIFEKR